MTQPRPLSDADLLVWAVVLEYRRRQEHAGHRFTLLTFPPCPTCGEQVTQAHTWWTRDPIQFDGFIDMQPCGHQHQAAAEDLERLHDHATEMLESLRHDVRSTEDLVQEAHARVGGEPWCCGGNAEDCPLCTDPNLPYPFLCPGHPRTAANERIVGETVQAATEATELDNPQADALAAEWHRRHQRLEELTRGPNAQVAIVEHVRGELVGLRGALGILLGGQVQEGTADFLGWVYYREWLRRQEGQS